MVERSRQRGHLALSAIAKRSHVSTGGMGQLGGIGGPQPPKRPTGGEVWHRPLSGVLAALGSPWLGANSGGRANRCSLHRSSLCYWPCPAPPTTPGPSTPMRG